MFLKQKIYWMVLGILYYTMSYIAYIGIFAIVFYLGFMYIKIKTKCGFDKCTKRAKHIGGTRESNISQNAILSHSLEPRKENPLFFCKYHKRLLELSFPKNNEGSFSAMRMSGRLHCKPEKSYIDKFSSKEGIYVHLGNVDNLKKCGTVHLSNKLFQIYFSSFKNTKVHLELGDYLMFKTNITIEKLYIQLFSTTEPLFIATFEIARLIAKRYYIMTELQKYITIDVFGKISDILFHKIYQKLTLGKFEEISGL